MSAASWPSSRVWFPAVVAASGPCGGPLGGGGKFATLFAWFGGKGLLPFARLGTSSSSASSNSRAATAR